MAEDHQRTVGWNHERERDDEGGHVVMTEKKPGGEPRRIRWSVSQADVSVLRWLDQQESISDSLRLLIRDSITRDGYIDVKNKPVEQQPRRGRPPASDGAYSERDEQDDGADVPGGRESRGDVADDGGNAAGGDRRLPAPGGGGDVSTEAPVRNRTSEPASNAAAAAPNTQVSIDEIMASTRR